MALEIKFVSIGSHRSKAENEYTEAIQKKEPEEESMVDVQGGQRARWWWDESIERKRFEIP